MLAVEAIGIFVCRMKMMGERGHYTTSFNFIYQSMLSVNFLNINDTEATVTSLTQITY
jgi:hypothetical protein